MANKRILKKHASQAVKRLANSLTVEQLTLEIEKLKVEKVKLQSLLEQARSESAKKTKRIAKLESQLKQTKTATQVYSKQVSILSKVSKGLAKTTLETKQKVKQQGFGKVVSAKRTREEVFTEYRKINIEHFMDRIVQLTNEYDEELINKIKHTMSTWSDQKLRDFIKTYKFNDIYYESDATYYGRSHDLDGITLADIYEYVSTF